MAAIAIIQTALLLAASPAALQPQIPVPPGAERVVAHDRWGGQLAICAEVPRQEAALMQRNGRRLPPTTIFLINGDVIRKVVTGLGGCDPAWAPDGTRIAFTAPDGLWVISTTDDTGERIVDTTIEENRYLTLARPRWSPDGMRIAYFATDRRQTRVQVVAADTRATVLTSPAAAEDMEWRGPRTLAVGGQVLSVP